MLHLGCPTNESLYAAPPDLSRRTVDVSNVPHKADINIHSGKITVDREYWRSLSEDGRRLLLFHELAHLQKSGCARACEAKPLGCERCADNRAGACLALSGFSERRMKSAIKEMNMQRSTFEGDVSAGFFAVFRRLNGTQYTTPTDLTLTGNGNTVSSAELTVTATTDPGIPASKQPPPNVDVPAESPTQPAPADIENAPQCACKTPSRNWEWIIGAAGGLFALGIILSKAAK